MLLFVTGATGFVGSHFVRQAVARGDSIRAVRRPGSLPRLPLPEAVEWIDAPLDSDFSSHFDGVECVVHLASHSPNPPYAPLTSVFTGTSMPAGDCAKQPLRLGCVNF